MILSFFPCHMRKETATRPVIRRRGREKERGSPTVTWRRRRKASQDGWWSASDTRVAVHGASSRRTVSHQFVPLGCSQSVLDKQLRSRGLSRLDSLRICSSFLSVCRKLRFWFLFPQRDHLLERTSEWRANLTVSARSVSISSAGWRHLSGIISDKVSAARRYEEVLERPLVGDILEEATETWLRMVNVSIVLNWVYVRKCGRFINDIQH